MGGARIVGPRAAPMSAAPGDSGLTPGTRSAPLAPPPAARRRFTGTAVTAAAFAGTAGEGGARGEQGRGPACT